MSNYTPPEPYAVNLNFKDEVQQIDAHNVVLNFGVDEIQTASLEAVIDIAFIAEIVAESYSLNTLTAEIQTGFSAEIQTIQGQLPQLNCTISTGFIAEITAVRIDQFCSLEAVIETAYTPDLTAQFDINFNLGVFHVLKDQYQQAVSVVRSCDYRFSKPLLRALNSAFFYDDGLVIEQGLNLKSERTHTLGRAVRTAFESGTGLNSGLNLLWQDNARIKAVNSFVFGNAEKLHIQRHLDWVELIRKRKQFTYSHEVAKHIEQTHLYEWDKGLELITTTSLPWDKAQAIHYKKHPIQPWPHPEIPEYVGSTDLNFNCKCTEIDAHNVILNFGVDDCIPSIIDKNWWYIVNEVSIINTRTNEEINVLNGSYGTDRSRWCWSYILAVTEPEMAKLQKYDVLKISVNGSVHMMMYEDHSKTQQFAKTIFTLSGRSQTALLGAEHTPTRSYLQENERTSVQLARAELDWVNSDTVLNWQLIDDLGWIVETESLSYTNQKPIEAIKMIAEAGGGFVYSEKDSNTLSIKPLYKNTYWNVLTADDYDFLISESFITQHSESFQDLLNYNAITLTNPRNGNVGQIKRRNTAGDILLEPVSNPLFNAVSMGGYGRSKLARAGRVESHGFDMPIFEHAPEQSPGNVVAFNGEWWGIVDAVDVSFTYSKVQQSIKVERTVYE